MDVEFLNQVILRVFFVKSFFSILSSLKKHENLEYLFITANFTFRVQGGKKRKLALQNKTDRSRSIILDCFDINNCCYTV